MQVVGDEDWVIVEIKTSINSATALGTQRIRHGPPA